jgi:predicted tellurium resistance membrane protein TerC
VTWQAFRLVAAALFGVFALILLVVPVVQIVRGRLSLRQLWGFLLAGMGFALLAAGVVIVPEANGQALIILGVILTVVGNLAQQRITRELTYRRRP